MMSERKKRLPELVKHNDILGKGRKPEARLQEVADQFTAINDVLKEELPRLYTLTSRLVLCCLHRFVRLQKQWQQVWLSTLSTSHPDIEASATLDSIVRHFRSTHDFCMRKASKFEILSQQTKSYTPTRSVAADGSVQDLSTIPESHSIGSNPDSYMINPSKSKQHERTHSKIFSSAMPVGEADSPVEATNTSDGNEDPEVLFLAASLFEFHIGDRKEAGYPYLEYKPGEVSIACLGETHTHLH